MAKEPCAEQKRTLVFVFLKSESSNREARTPFKIMSHILHLKLIHNAGLSRLPAALATNRNTHTGIHVDFCQTVRLEFV